MRDLNQPFRHNITENLWFIAARDDSDCAIGCSTTFSALSNAQLWLEVPYKAAYIMCNLTLLNYPKLSHTRYPARNNHLKVQYCARFIDTLKDQALRDRYAETIKHICGRRITGKRNKSRSGPQIPSAFASSHRSALRVWWRGGDGLLLQCGACGAFNRIEPIYCALLQPIWKSEILWQRATCDSVHPPMCAAAAARGEAFYEIVLAPSPRHRGMLLRACLSVRLFVIVKKATNNNITALCLSSIRTFGCAPSSSRHPHLAGGLWAFEKVLPFSHFFLALAELRGGRKAAFPKRPNKRWL